MTQGLSQAGKRLAEAKSDEELFLAFLSLGDRGALESLIARQLSFAYRVAFSVCGDRDLAEEVVQECWVILAGWPPNFQDRGPGSFRRWYCTVLRNKARHLRVSGRRPLRTQGRGGREDRRRLGEHQASEPGAPPSERAEQLACLSSAILELGDDLRIPLILHFQQGFAQQEIAGALKISQSLVSRRIAQGLETLKKRMLAQGLPSLSTVLTVTLRDPLLIPMPGSLAEDLSRFLLKQQAPRTVPARAFAAPPKASGLAWLALAMVMLVASLLIIWQFGAASRSPAGPGTPGLSTHSARTPT